AVAFRATAQLELLEGTYGDLPLNRVVGDGTEHSPDGPQIEMGPIPSYAQRSCYGWRCISDGCFCTPPPTGGEIVVGPARPAPLRDRPDNAGESDPLRDEVVCMRIHFPEGFSAPAPP